MFFKVKFIFCNYPAYFVDLNFAKMIDKMKPCGSSTLWFTIIIFTNADLKSYEFISMKMKYIKNLKLLFLLLSCFLFLPEVSLHSSILNCNLLATFSSLSGVSSSSSHLLRPKVKSGTVYFKMGNKE